MSVESGLDSRRPFDGCASPEGQRVPIDVLIPVYNGARWLQIAVQSIQRQTYPALQIHVVDDGSTDSTPAILSELAGGDSRIHIHRRVNGGIVAALNEGLGHCSSPFVARHDADDIAYPDRLQRQMAYLQAHPDCVAVGAVARHIDPHGTACGTLTVLPPPDEADAHWFPAREPYLMHPFLLVRRSALMAAGAYRLVPLAEDSDLYWRLRECGRLHNLPDILGEYRLHGDSASAASIHNGRLMAVGSQLAALSARRRAQRCVDVVFDAGQIARLRQAPTLDAMVSVASAPLAEDERDALALAIGSKLLALADYQPYEIEAADGEWIRTAWQRGERLLPSVANRRELRRLFTRTAVRLHLAGRVADARALLPPRWLAEYGLRWSLRKVLGAGARRRLHGWMHGNAGARP